MAFFNFKENKLQELAKLDYKSKSHTFNKSVIASYNNVGKYGYKATNDYIRVDQSKRTVFFILNPDADVTELKSDKTRILLCEHPIFKKKTKEVCYDLEQIFSEQSTAINRGIKFATRPEVTIVDFNKGQELDDIYGKWKQTKEDDKKTFLISFNPARYYRSYQLLDCGFNIYQKLILIKQQPYALINFSKQGEMAFELSFLSLFKNAELKLINDQNDCIIIHCLHDLYMNHGVRFVNLGTSAGIKGLKFFKEKLPHTEQIVYSE